MNLRVFISMTVLAILWGSAFPMIKVGLEGLSPPHLTLARFLVASLCFVPFLLLSKKRLLPWRQDIPYFFLLGFLGITVYHLGLNFGQLYVTAGAASLIIASAPVMAAVLAYFLVGDRLPLLGWFGSLVAFSGIVLIVLGEGADLGINPYALLILMSALATSFYAVLQTRMFSRYKAVEVSAFATWAGTVPLLIFLPGFSEQVANAGALPLLAAIYIGVFPAAVAYGLFAYALSKAPVTLVTAYLYSVPVYSLLFSWLLISEVPGWLTLLGGVIAVLGIIVVNRAKRRVAVPNVPVRVHRKAI